MGDKLGEQHWFPDFQRASVVIRRDCRKSPSDQGILQTPAQFQGCLLWPHLLHLPTRSSCSSWSTALATLFCLPSLSQVTSQSQ